MAPIGEFFLEIIFESALTNIGSVLQSIFEFISRPGTPKLTKKKKIRFRLKPYK